MMSTRARSPEVDELSCVPETQQAAGVEELVVRVEDPLEMSDTEQGDIGLETQHKSDTSDKDTQDTQVAGGTQKGKGTGKGKADKRSKKPPVLFSAEQEQTLVEDKDACPKWSQVHLHEVRPGEPQLTERQKWTTDNFDFLRDHIMCHLTTKSEFRAPKGSPSQASAAEGSSSRREIVQMKPFQKTSRTESTCDPSDILHLDTHTPTNRSRAVSVTSSLADSDLQAAFAESQRVITELKDIVVKKFGEDKPDKNPRMGFCDFLKVELEQLTSDSYDEFQQETFNLLIRLKRRDKQQQRYQHGMGTSMAQTITYSQVSMSHHYPVSHTQMQAPHQQMQQTFTHVLQGLSQQQLQHSQQHFQQTFTQPHTPAQQQQQSMEQQQNLQPMQQQQAIQPMHSIESQQPVQQPQQQQQTILTHQPIQQQPTQQHSQQTSQQKTSQSTTSAINQSISCA